ncbi:MAG: 50S ribosomal protein L20 [Candidatus Sumerlaeia bacterium]
MPRATNSPAARQRHKKFIKRAKGYFNARHRLYTVARDAVRHAGQYAFRDRRRRKRDFRRLWITRINAAARQSGLSYSQLMHGLQQAGVEVDRKILADLAVHDQTAFAALVETARKALEAA